MSWRIIGSTALHHWYPNELNPPNDLDLLTPIKFSGSNSKICIVETSWHDVAEEMISINKDPVFLDPDLCFTLKVSHAHWNIKWDKTMFHINFLKNKGCQLNFDIYKKLFKVWTEVHGKKHVNMNKQMTDFFKDSVVRKYDHEMLHELVAFHQKPWHEFLRPDHGIAWCSEEKFNSLTYEQQCEVALEEFLVVLIERNPQLTLNSLNSHVYIAASKIYNTLVTSMTTGWFARFLILNHQQLLYKERTKWKTQMESTLKILSR